MGIEFYEKFCDFHRAIAAHNIYGEMTFEEFIKVYQLLHSQYQSKDSILGKLFINQTTASSEEGSTASSPMPELEDGWQKFR